MAQLLKNFEHWMQSSVSTVPLGSVTFSDNEQNAIRIGLSTLSVAWGLATIALSTSASPRTVVPSLVAAAYLIASLFLHHAWRNLYSLTPLPMHKIFVLRVVCLIADVMAISLFVAHSGGAAIPLMPVYLSAIIGYGMRFGRTYTFLCLCVSEVTFVGAAFNNEWLIANPVIIGSQCITMAILPFYVIGLLQRYSVVLEAHVHSLGETKEYLSLVSHEIRAPLQGIVSIVEGASASLSGKTVSVAAPSLIASLDGIRSCAERVLDVANRVSAQRSRAIGTPLRSTTTRFSPVFDTARCIGICTAAAADSRALVTWRVENSMPPVIPIESSLVHDILINLLDNAHKAAPAGRINVSVRIDGQGDSPNLVISVSDSGSSPAPDSILPSVGISTCAELRPNRGLGLTIVRADLRELSGRLEFSARPHGGSDAIVSIPLRAEVPPFSAENGITLLHLFSSTPLPPERLKKLVELGLFPLVSRVTGIPSANYTSLHVPLIAAYCNEPPESLLHVNRISAYSNGAARPIIGIHEGNLSIGDNLQFNYILDLSSASVANQALALGSFRRLKTRKSPRQNFKPVKILLCEDSSVVAAALQSSLLEGGYHCDLAATEVHALQRLESESYDLVITDRFLGEVDILESHLSRELAVSDQISILLTAESCSYLSNSHSLEGFFQVLIKPVTAMDLLANISRALESRGLQVPQVDQSTFTQGINSSFETRNSNEQEASQFVVNNELALSFKTESLVDLAVCLNHISFGQRRLAKLSIHRLIGALQFLGAKSAEESAQKIGESLMDLNGTHTDSIESFAELAEQIFDLFERHTR